MNQKTCKDCIHHEVCKYKDEKVSLGTKTCELVADDFKCFKDKSRIVELPCKVGDTVYEIRPDRGFIQEYTVITIHISRCDAFFDWELIDGEGIYSNVNGFTVNMLGKTVFLSKTMIRTWPAITFWIPGICAGVRR